MVDIVSDIIRVNGKAVEAVQIWVSRGHEDAWQHDPAQAVIFAVLDANPGAFVIWRMHDQKAMTFGRDAEGRLGRSPVTVTLTDDEFGEGNVVERQIRIMTGKV